MVSVAGLSYRITWQAEQLQVTLELLFIGTSCRTEAWLSLSAPFPFCEQNPKRIISIKKSPRPVGIITKLLCGGDTACQVSLQADRFSQLLQLL